MIWPQIVPLIMRRRRIAANAGEGGKSEGRSVESTFRFGFGCGSGGERGRFVKYS